MDSASVRRLLLKALQSKSDPDACTAYILKALEVLEELPGSPVGIDAITSRPRPSGLHRPSIAQYNVESVHRGAVLLEDRPNQNHPFRVPFNVYVSLSAALQGHEDEFNYHFLQTLAGERYDEVPRLADYHIRVCLRFWIKFGLIQKIGARWYKLKSPSSFKEDARQRWDDIASGLGQPNEVR